MIDASVANYKDLVANRNLSQDPTWRISQNWNYIRPGDEAFLYSGNNGYGILGYAIVENVNKSARSVTLEFDFNRCQMLLDSPIKASLVRGWIKNIRKSPASLEHCSEYLYPILPWNLNASFPEEISFDLSYREGLKTQVYVNRYERDPNARLQCIKEYGTRCSVCNIDLSEVYGTVMKGFIHVHHLVPLSSVPEKYEMIPSRDLRPVCPNCHAAIHRRRPPYTIEEAKELIARRSNSKI